MAADPQTPITPVDLAAPKRKRIADIKKAVQEGYQAGANDAWERRTNGSMRSSRSSTSSRATFARSSFRHPPVQEEDQNNEQSMFVPSVVNQGVEEVTNILEQSTKKTIFKINKIGRPRSVNNYPTISEGQGNPFGRRGSHQAQFLGFVTF
jgi:hypothetical protein